MSQALVINTANTREELSSMTDPKRLLDLAYSEITTKIGDFSPADLNALVKTLHAVKKDEEPEAITSSMGGFIAKHVKNK